jgi:hypothetical protein
LGATEEEVDAAFKERTKDLDPEATAQLEELTDARQAVRLHNTWLEEQPAVETLEEEIGAEPEVDIEAEAAPEVSLAERIRQRDTGLPEPETRPEERALPQLQRWIADEVAAGRLRPSPEATTQRFETLVAAETRAVERIGTEVEAEVDLEHPTPVPVEDAHEKLPVAEDDITRARMGQAGFDPDMTRGGYFDQVERELTDFSEFGDRPEAREKMVEKLTVLKKGATFDEMPRVVRMIDKYLPEPSGGFLSKAESDLRGVSRDWHRQFPATEAEPAPTPDETIAKASEETGIDLTQPQAAPTEADRRYHAEALLAATERAEAEPTPEPALVTVQFDSDFSDLSLEEIQQVKIIVEGKLQKLENAKARGEEIIPSYPRDLREDLRTINARLEEMAGPTTEEVEAPPPGAEAVGEEGGVVEGKVLYHGTPTADFETFDTYGSRHGLYGKGAYFTDNPEVASRYAETRKAPKGVTPQPGVKPVRVKVDNPIDMDASANPAQWQKAFEDFAEDVADGMTNGEAYKSVEEAIADEGVYPDYEGAEMMQDGIISMGYDGIVHVGGGRVGDRPHNVTIAFHPEQIESAYTPPAPAPPVEAAVEADLFEEPPKGAVPIGPRSPQSAAVGRKTLDQKPTAEVRDLAEGMDLDASGPVSEVADRVLETKEQVVEDITEPGIKSLYAGVPIIGLPAKAGGEVAVALNDVGFIDLVDRLRRVSQDPLIQEAADQGRRAISTMKSLLGEMAPTLRRLLPTLGSLPTTAKGRVLGGLQRISWAPGNIWGVDRFRLALENRLPADQELTAAEKPIVSAVQAFLKETGHMAEREGLQQFNYRTGEWQPFVVREGDVAPRLATLWYFDTLMIGEGARFDALAKAIAEANNLDPAEVQQTLQEQRAELIGTGERDPSPFRRINAEHMRVWPVMPSYIRDVETGRRVELLESNPFRYVERLAELTASRLSYVRHFGQETEGTSLVNRLVETVRERKGGADEVLALTRALNGMPVERSFYHQPGSALSELAIGLTHASSLLKSGALSLTFVPNMVEPMANIQALAGGPAMKDFWVTLWNLYSGSERRAVTIAALEEMGAISLWVRNMSWNPQRPGESLSRIGREIPTLVVRAFWRSQERLSAELGRVKAERMAAGKGTKGDIADARVMLNVSLPEARTMAEGKGTPEQYLALARRAGAFTTNSPMARAEVSRIEHSRLFKTAFAFTRYAMMKVRWLGQYGPVVVEDVKHLHEARQARDANPDPDTERAYREAWGDAAASSGKVARMLTGTTAAGTAQYFLMALVTGGMLGVKDAWDDFAEEPLRFLRDSFLYTMFAGPFGSIIRLTRNQSRVWYESVLQVTWPGALAIELSDFMTGSGRYRDRGPEEKLAAFVDRFLPINRAVAQGLAALGYGSDAKKMNTALRSYWKHVRRINPQGRYAASSGESIIPDVAKEQKIHAEFRVHMRRATEAIRKGQDPQEHIDRALQLEGKDAPSVAASIRGRRVLTGAMDPESTSYVPSVREALERRVSKETMELLQLHDQLLDTWARSVTPPTSQRPGPSKPRAPSRPK